MSASRKRGPGKSPEKRNKSENLSPGQGQDDTHFRVWYCKEEDLIPNVMTVESSLIIAEFITTAANKLGIKTPCSRLVVVFNGQPVSGGLAIPDNTSDNKPLIIREIQYSLEEELQRFQAQLANYTAVPSGQTEKECIQKLIRGVYSYDHFIRCAEKGIYSLTINTATDIIWSPYQVIRKAYNFQAHESSTFIKVSMLLAAAFGPLGLSIEPDVVFNLPVARKRGRPYAVDCLVTEYSEEKNDSYANDDTASDSMEGASNLFVKDKKTIKMVVEIKKTVAKSLLLLEPPDLLEMFIYCHYTLRTNKQDKVKGVLTDGLDWHCFDLKFTGLSMELTRYETISCTSEREVIGTLPSLL